MSIIEGKMKVNKTVITGGVGEYIKREVRIYLLSQPWVLRRR